MSAHQLAKDRAKKLKAQQDAMRRAVGELPPEANPARPIAPEATTQPNDPEVTVAGIPADPKAIERQQEIARTRSKKPALTAFQIYTQQQQRQARRKAGEMVHKQNAHRAE